MKSKEEILQEIAKCQKRMEEIKVEAFEQGYVGNVYQWDSPSKRELYLFYSDYALALNWVLE